MDCIFCKILNGEIPSNKVYEDDNFIAILDAFPANEGHTIVIPKKHYANIFEIDDNTLKEGYSLARKIAIAIKDAFSIEDINMLQNNGATAGQSVGHFHIHIIPRVKEDGVVIKSEVVSIEKEKLEDIKNKIKDSLK